MVLISKKRRTTSVLSRALGYTTSRFNVSTDGQSFRWYLNEWQNLEVNILTINILIINILIIFKIY